jgi:hypothetical protein
MSTHWLDYLVGPLSSFIEIFNPLSFPLEILGGTHASLAHSSFVVASLCFPSLDHMG